MKVFITRKLPGEPEKLLKSKGLQVEVYNSDEPIPRELFLKKTKNVDAVLALLSEKINREAIDNFSKCKIVANCAVGYNNVDVNYAKEKNLIITNTPNVLTDATADIAAGLIIACARRFHEGEKLIRDRKFYGWKPNMLLGLNLKNKTLGIIGAGRIGFATAKRLKAFGMKIIYYDRNKRMNFDIELSAKKVTLEKLMKTSDVISIHLPLTEQTFHLLDKEKLKLMKSTAVLVNTARGEIVEEKYLIHQLQRKKIFAAGFDVYENEPNINPKLLELENVFLLPHIGSATKETRAAMSILAANNIINVLEGKKPLTPIY